MQEKLEKISFCIKTDFFILPNFWNFYLVFFFQNELELAVSFYLTTLALQSTFEPARDRLIAISCKNRDILKNLERKNSDAQKWKSILWLIEMKKIVVRLCTIEIYISITKNQSKVLKWSYGQEKPSVWSR